MNNRQNGRRRGRGGQQTRNGQPGSQDRGNRIDNRARGNAAQLLEKYKSLARDAQMAGDRVNTEYYLQFADHYFRVLAESRSRFEEQRPQQARRDDFRDEFGQDGDDEQDGQSGFDQRGENPGNWNDGEDEQPRQDNRREERQERPRREDRPERQERPRRFERPERAEQAPQAEGAEQPVAEEAAPRAERRPRRERSSGAGEGRGARNAQAPRAEAVEEVSDRLEADRLPLGFSTIPATPAAAEEGAAGEVEAPRPRRTRAPRKPKAETATVDA